MCFLSEEVLSLFLFFLYKLPIKRENVKRSGKNVSLFTRVKVNGGGTHRGMAAINKIQQRGGLVPFFLWLVSFQFLRQCSSRCPWMSLNFRIRMALNSEIHLPLSTECRD